MGTIESISFDKGLCDRKSPLILEDGELVTASGVDYDNPGQLTNRPARQVVNSTQYGGVTGIHRYINNVIMNEGSNSRWKWDLNGYCGLYTPASEDFTLLGANSTTKRPRYADYEEFIFMCNGKDRKVFTDGGWYEWEINAPTSAPATVTGSSGKPKGTYTCYVTFYVMFPSGRSYETAFSESSTVTCASQQIAWSKIPTCPYEGDNLKIYRKLYRTSTSLIDTYNVTTIYDNTTTTYTDNESDATLLTGDASEVSTYIPCPEDIVDVTQYLMRLFVIAGSYLYPSEPYLPFTFSDDTWLQITSDGDDLVCISSWGDQLYIGTRKRWYRLQGNSPDTWQVRTSFAEQGIINRHTLVKTRYGLLGLWYDGIYLFDGSVSRNISSKKLQASFFTSIYNTDDCYASWNGNKYYFHYSTTSSTLDKRLVLDMTDYPEIRFYHDDFIPTAHEFHFDTGIDYYGYNGYQYEDGGTQTIAMTLQTGDRAAKNILQQKQLEYLYYDINTTSKDVTVSIYADGTSVYSDTINHSSRTRKRVILPNKAGYRFSLKLTCADFQSVVIYAPWAISFNPFGE